MRTLRAPRLQNRLAELGRSRGALEPLFVATAAEQFGVRCAYADPARLGVDRWVAVLAAHHASAGAACVLDAGTAVTFDAVDSGGRHLGGLIFAGMHLVAAALQQHTSGIGPTPVLRPAPVGLDLLGRSTDTAVANGALLALAAALDRAVATVERALGERPAVYLTGGDAPAIAAWLETEAELRADLVLEGLALFAGPATGPARRALMRNWFLALVLANLAFAAWHAWFSGRPSGVRPPSEDAPSIELLSELPREAARSPGSGAAASGVRRPGEPAAGDKPPNLPRATVPTPDADAGSSAVAGGAKSGSAGNGAEGGAEAPRCVSVGPYRELAQAATAAANLRTAGYRADATGGGGRYLDRLLGLHRGILDRSGGQRGSREGSRTAADRLLCDPQQR